MDSLNIIICEGLTCEDCGRGNRLEFGFEAMSLPNKISLTRIVFILPFVICIIQVQNNSLYRYIALAMMFVLGATDAIDGYLARKRNEITELGKYLDPAADKLLLVTACILLSSKMWPEPRFPNWLPVIVLSRDIFIVLGTAALILFTGKMGCKPNTLGRATTCLQVIAVMSVLISNHLPITTVIIASLVAAAFTLASGINYMYMGIKQYRLECTF
ncbi:MAG: CDP-alcohol phosphatidyltransferase family protein [Candidatus Brocadiales bacterium]